MTHALDPEGEQKGCRCHLCRGVPAALDGRVPFVITHAGLQELRGVAARSACPLADMLLAVFGLVLDRHAAHRDASIAILSADPGLPGRVRQWAKGGLQDPGGATMPLALRLAIARGNAALARLPPTSWGVAFRHTRRGSAQDASAPEPPAAHMGLHQVKGDFDLVLDIAEFDDMLLVECLFSTQATSIQSMEKLVRDYVHALQAVVKSFDSEP